MATHSRTVLVDAWQSFNAIGGETAEIPVWVLRACMKGEIYADGPVTKLRMADGSEVVEDGDWLIKAKDGQIHVCKHDEFLEKYEPLPRVAR